MHELCDKCLELTCECGSPDFRPELLPRDTCWNLEACGALMDGSVSLDSDTIVFVRGSEVRMKDSSSIGSDGISIDAKKLIMVLKVALIEANEHRLLLEGDDIPF